MLCFFMQLNSTGAASYQVALDAIKRLHEKIEILTEHIAELEATQNEGK